MSFSRTFGLAVLAVFLPNVSIGQELSAKLTWGSSIIKARPDISCPGQAKGFEIAAKGIETSLRASGDFALPSTSHLRVRKGNNLSADKNHFRPATKTIENRQVWISITEGRMTVEGRDNVHATADISLSGCRVENDLDFLGGHLRLTGQAANYRIEVDDSLQNLMATEGGFDAIKFNFTVPLASEPADGAGKFLHRLQRNSMQNVRGGIGLFVLDLTFNEWQFPSVKAGSAPLTASVRISGGTVLVDSEKATTDTD